MKQMIAHYLIMLACAGIGIYFASQKDINGAIGFLVASLAYSRLFVNAFVKKYL
jgi:hypothetical protein